MSILAAEARRASRRWSTPALRVGFALVLLVVLVVTVAISGETELWRTGEGGRAVFQAARWTALLLLAFIAPTLGALGVDEERGGARLDLLTLTRIPPWRLFADKVGSRLLLSVAVLAAAVPLLALSTMYGGVSPGEVLATAITATHLSALAALLGGWISLRVGRGILASVGALVLVFALWVLLPAWGLVGWDVPPLSNPLPALSLDPTEAALGLAASVPLMVVVLVDGARCIAGRGTTTLELALLVPLSMSTLGYPGLTGVLEGVGGGWSAPVVLALWVPALALTSLGVGWLPVRLAGVTVAAVRDATPARAAPAEAHRSSAVVWSNPVAWRELKTHAHGRLGCAHAAVGFVVVIVVWLGLAMALEGSGDLGALLLVTLVGVGALTFAWGLLVTGYVAGRLGTDEAVGQTVDLLSLTTTSRARLILGKLAGAAVHGLVPLLGGTALVCIPVVYLGAVEQELLRSPATALYAALDLGLIAAVVVAAWAALSLGGLGLGLVLPRPRAVPALTLGAAALLLPAAALWLPSTLALALFAEDEPEWAVVGITVQLVAGSILAAIAAVGAALAHHRLAGRPSR